MRSVSSGGCTTHQVNTPLNDSDQPAPAEEIEVTDPTHSLFGRRFRILSVHDSPGSVGYVFVPYRSYSALRIELEATSLAPSPLRPSSPATKLTSQAVIEVIDSDLGFTGSEVQHRQGFKELTAQVTLGQIGIVLSSEVTRLSRNCSDWYPLLDVCGYKGCLIADHDGVYDPATVNGRLVLGLKGTLSEMELHTICSRMRAGIVNKAERGELALKLPTGLARDEHGLVHKDPNLEVQDRISLVFESFMRLRSANKVLLFFNEDGLLVPRLDRFGDIVWKRPTIETITSILKNPAYAGAFVYGRNIHTTTRGPNGNIVKTKRLPMKEWRILIKDKYPAYVNWETFERIQAMLQDNHAEYERNMTRGVPRAGRALLAGLVYCGECSHKMEDRYPETPRYF